MSDQPGGPTDSAGQTWQGRHLSSTGFDHDTGAPDPAVRAALEAPDDEITLMAALSTARLLVPVVAAPTEVERVGELTADKAADMAVVTLVAPDGQRALPVFSGLDTLNGWDAEARPSPVTASTAAQAAVSERCDVMVVDLGVERPVVLRPSMVWALAQERDWLPAHADPHVQRAVRDAVRDEPEVLDAELRDGADAGPGALRVELALLDGLTSDDVQAVATRVGERIASDGETRARVDARVFAGRRA